MKVHVGSILHAYTGGRAVVEARGATVAEVLEDLERRHAGLRFRVVDEQGRIRPHVHVYVGSERVRDLAAATGRAAELHILAALSGG
jgi:hypothetical protein